MVVAPRPCCVARVDSTKNSGGLFLHAVGKHRRMPTDNDLNKFSERAPRVQLRHPDVRRRFSMRFRARSLKQGNSFLYVREVRKGFFVFSTGLLIYVFSRAYVNFSLSSTEKIKRRQTNEELAGQIELSAPSESGAYHVPDNFNRLHVPWIRRQSPHLLTAPESRHRFLYTSTRTATSDGIGHSMGVINREFRIALRMNLTYTHRVGQYSSLTANDRRAVEHFFGWGDGEFKRKDIQREGCIPKGGRWPSEDNIYDCQVCEAPALDGALGIKHLVQIPPELVEACHDPRCSRITSAFLEKHPHSHTIFQLSSENCDAPETDSNYLKTKGLFYEKYWNRHGVLPWIKSRRPDWKERALRNNENELNVAIHVRRGDFLRPEVRAKRGITRDEVFAQTLVDALSIVGQTGGVFADMAIALHIYSEGRMRSEKKAKSVHAVDLQDQTYYDSTGVARDGEWWKSLILSKSPRSNLSSIQDFTERLRISMHVSEDTLLCLHEMVSADIFIGSKSGLSNSLVWSLSRGVGLIPHSGTIDNEVGKIGHVCCSVPFKEADGSYSHELFQRYWRAYVQSNERSAKRAQQHSAQE